MAENFLDRLRPAAPTRPAVMPSVSARDASAYAAAALKGEVDNLLAVPIGSGRNHQLNISAMKMGQLVAAGAIDERTVTEVLGAADGGLEFKATRDTIASGLKAGIAQGRAIPEPTHPGSEVPPWERSDDPLDDNYYAPPPPTSPPTLAGGSTSGPPSPATSTDTTGSTSSTGLTDPSRRSVPDADATSTAQLDAQYDALVAAEASRVRLQRDARRRVDYEDAAKLFRVPTWAATLTAELAIESVPVRYRVDRLIPNGANVVLAAMYKAGKTTFVTNLTRSLVDGDDFLGRYSIDPVDGRVGIFNYEVSRDQYREWLRDVDMVHTDRAVTLPLRGFRLDLRVPSIETWVVDWLVRHDVRVWIVDPFAAAATGIDENSNTEVGAFLNTLDVIKERAGVSELILPVHTGRAEQEQGEERARGATRLDDWADVRWLLTKDKADVRYFRATGRDVETDEAALKFNTDTRRLTLTGGNRRENEADRYRGAVTTILTNKPGASTSDIITGVRQLLGSSSDARVKSTVAGMLAGQGMHTRKVGKTVEHHLGRSSHLPDADPLA